MKWIYNFMQWCIFLLAESFAWVPSTDWLSCLSIKKASCWSGGFFSLYPTIMSNHYASSLFFWCFFLGSTPKRMSSCRAFLRPSLHMYVHLPPEENEERAQYAKDTSIFFFLFVFAEKESCKGKRPKGEKSCPQSEQPQCVGQWFTGPWGKVR